MSKELRMFDVNGQTIFPVYGVSGGLSAQWMFYLYEPLSDGKIKVLPVIVPALPFETRPAHLIASAKERASERFDELAHIVSEGGDMGGLDGTAFRA